MGNCMRSILSLVVLSLLLSGCVIYPKHQIEKPSEKVRAPICVDIVFERYRDAFWSMGMSDFPIEPFELEFYRNGLAKFGVNTNCINPLRSYRVKMNIHSGLRASAPRTYWGLFSMATFMIVPVTYDVSYDLELSRESTLISKQTRDLVQWGWVFMSYESAKQESEYGKEFGVRDVGFASIIADVARMIRYDFLK